MPRSPSAFDYESGNALVAAASDGVAFATLGRCLVGFDGQLHWYKSS